LFKAALARIGRLIQQLQAEWSQETPEEGAKIPIDTTKEFYRLYSALQFIYCQPPGRGQGEFDNYDLFGDGPLWAGCAIMYFLRQRQRFETLDFSYFVLNTEEIKPTADVCTP
jgi:cytoplasmic FMR1 interacting protein